VSRGRRSVTLAGGSALAAVEGDGVQLYPLSSAFRASARTMVKAEGGVSEVCDGEGEGDGDGCSAPQ
jgi:hypothetical protein